MVLEGFQVEKLYIIKVKWDRKKGDLTERDFFFFSFWNKSVLKNSSGLSSAILTVQHRNKNSYWIFIFIFKYKLKKKKLLSEITIFCVIFSLNPTSIFLRYLLIQAFIAMHYFIYEVFNIYGNRDTY